jgi:NADH dehydrogenase
MSERRKRIVILGGGFGGVHTAVHLEKALRRRDDLEILLINKDNYFVFQPMLAEVVSGSVGMLDTVSPIRRMLPRTDLHVRDVESIDTRKQTITTTPGFRRQPNVIHYDHLVLALGNVTDFRGLRGLPEHAIPFKNLSDALFIRNHVIHVLEEAAIEHVDVELRKQLLTFVVAGGGFSGVEVVAELNDFVRRVIRNYSQLDPGEVRFVLLHSQDRILPELDAKLALYAQAILAGRGVEICLNTRLDAATGHEAILADGKRIPTRTLISTIPSSPNPLVDTLDLPKERGRLKVDSSLLVQGTDNVWAMGDCALVTMTDGNTCPPTAQFAMRQARTAAHNIVAAIRGGEQKMFQFKELGKLAALGHRSAVAQVFGFNVSGFLAWFLWRTIYLMKLPGWGRRLKVAVSWTLDLFLPPELVQLRLTSSMGVAHEHFEPGEEIFRQGDLGDRIYIIANGHAEVVHQTDGAREILLAQLGPGEYFGEMALLNQTTRNATVRCAEPLDVLSIHKREFSMLAANLPAMRASFEQVMEQRRMATEGKLAQIA